jgi:DNA-binding NarL/FixJ family response regulator
MRKHKIFVVDDHPLMRRGIIQLLNKQEMLMVSGSASDGPDALQEVLKEPPDMMVIDLTLKNSSGMDLIKEILSIYPGMPVLVLSMHDEKIYAERVMKAGAKGYIMKDAPPKELLKAVHQILNGKNYLSESASSHIIEKSFSRTEPVTGSDASDLLTDRELQVFDLTGRGETSEEIAIKLHLSVKTVDTYKARIKEKLHIENSAQLTKQAVEWVIRQEK